MRACSHKYTETNIPAHTTPAHAHIHTCVHTQVYTQIPCTDILTYMCTQAHKHTSTYNLDKKQLTLSSEIFEVQA